MTVHDIGSSPPHPGYELRRISKAAWAYNVKGGYRNRLPRCGISLRELVA
jgi:hypothetical protein